MPLTPQQQMPYYSTQGGATPTNIKTYIALLNQTGTTAPIPTIQQNTIGNIVWTRLDAGDYLATLPNTFPALKTTLNNPNTSTTGSVETILFTNTEDGEPSNSLSLKTMIAGTPQDGNLYNTTIKITIYP